MPSAARFSSLWTAGRVSGFGPSTLMCPIPVTHTHTRPVLCHLAERRCAHRGLLPAQPPPAAALRTRRPRRWSRPRLAPQHRSPQPRHWWLPAARLSSPSGPFSLILRPWAVPPPLGLTALALPTPFSSLPAAAFGSAPLLFLPLLDRQSAPLALPRLSPDCALLTPFLVSVFPLARLLPACLVPAALLPRCSPAVPACIWLPVRCRLLPGCGAPWLAIAPCEVCLKPVEVAALFRSHAIGDPPAVCCSACAPVLARALLCLPRCRSVCFLWRPPFSPLLVGSWLPPSPV